MKLMEELRQIQRMVKESGSYVGSSTTRENIANFYRNTWLPISEDFKKKFGKENFKVIEDNAHALYDLVKAPKPWKTDLLRHIGKIEEILDEIEIDSIRRQGSVIEINAKEEITNILKSKGFADTVSYIKKAETEFSGGNYKECCYQARLAIEEFFRNMREKFSGKSVGRGILRDHMDYLQKQANVITFSERQLIQRGFYAFLSEKGNHATEDVPSLEDGKLSLYILYTLIEYCLDKLQKKI